jgi:hypothetical protein
MFRTTEHRVLAATGPRTALVAVATPNNPTGKAASGEALRRLSGGAPQALVLADLAYAEFADDDPTRAMLALPNVIVARTLSKAWGLAGLRIGYMVGPEQVIGWLRAAGGPYSVAGPSLALAAARLLGDDADVHAYVSRVREERANLFELLTQLGAEALPRRPTSSWRFDRSPWVWRRWPGSASPCGSSPRHRRSRAICASPVRAARKSSSGSRCPARDPLAPSALFDLDGVLADVSARTGRPFSTRRAPSARTSAPTSSAKPRATPNGEN